MTNRRKKQFKHPNITSVCICIAHTNNSIKNIRIIASEILVIKNTDVKKNICWVKDANKTQCEYFTKYATQR